jgi:hypothetical protein
MPQSCSEKCLAAMPRQCAFRDILIKGNQEPANLNEYDLVCSGLEDDVKYSLMIREHLKALTRRRS